MTLFKDLSQGSKVFALIKGEELKYVEGSIVSVSQPRYNLPTYNASNPIPNVSQPPQVIDVTYSLDGKNYTDTIDTTAGVFPSDKPGSVTLVATDKEAVVRELYATKSQSEDYLKDVAKHEKRLKECDELIAAHDTAYNEKMQMEKRVQKLEESTEQTNKMLHDILTKLDKK